MKITIFDSVRNLFGLKKQSALSALLLFIFCETLSAQINIEDLRQKDLSEGIHIAISENVAYNTGNTEFYKLKTSLRSDYFKGNYHVFLLGSFQKGEEEGKPFLNKAFVHLRGLRSLNRNYIVEIFIQNEFNKIILLKDRNLAGGGLRIAVLSQTSESEDKSSITMHIGVGAMWENEVIDLGQKKEINLLRSTNYLSLRWQIDKRLNLSSTTYFQADTRRLSDYRILFDSSINYKITKRLALITSVEFRYDNQPPPDVENHDLEITNGLSYSF